MQPTRGLKDRANGNAQGILSDVHNNEKNISGVITTADTTGMIVYDSSLKDLPVDGRLNGKTIYNIGSVYKRKLDFGIIYQTMGDELITSAGDRITTTGSNWTNTDLATYSETKGLVLQADAAAQSCYLNSALTTAGRKYSVMFRISSISGTWQLKWKNSGQLIAQFTNAQWFIVDSVPTQSSDMLQIVCSELAATGTTDLSINYFSVKEYLLLHSKLQNGETWEVGDVWVIGNHSLDITDSTNRHDEQTATGTTTNTYATAMTIDARGYDNIGISIEETGGANAINWKILGYKTYSGSNDVEMSAAAGVDPSQQDTYDTNEPFAKIVIQVASKVPDSHGDYRIEVCKRRR